MQYIYQAFRKYLHPNHVIWMQFFTERPIFYCVCIQQCSCVCGANSQSLLVQVNNQIIPFVLYQPIFTDTCIKNVQLFQLRKCHYFNLYLEHPSAINIQIYFYNFFTYNYDLILHSSHRTLHHIPDSMISMLCVQARMYMSDI